jgi:hypothetical protein
MHPQAKRSFLDTGPAPFHKDAVRATCALGAAWFASGGRSYEDTVTQDFMTPRGFAITGQRITKLELPEEWHVTLAVWARCPVLGCWGSGSLGGAIQHLNDDHDWTREQIADWVESIEQRDQPDSAPAVREDEAEPVMATRAAD